MIFTSDNGPTTTSAAATRPSSTGNGALRGLKGSLYEGGIRVPLIVRWPGHITPGTVVDAPAAYSDILPTLCDAAGAEAPKDIDGLDLFGAGRHEFLYWEFPGYGGQQAVRAGDWKAVRTDLRKAGSRPALYDLAKDVGETTDVAAANPEVVARIEKLLKESRVPSTIFPMKALDEVR